MSPWLLGALGATVLATGGLALWPADAPDDLLPPDRSTNRADARPTAATRLQSRAAPIAPSAASAPAAQPATAGSARNATPGPAPTAPQLPTRPADWPAAPAAALAAWQGPPPPAPPPPTLAMRPVVPAASAAGPVFPYRWIGQLDDGGAPQVLLASAQRSVAVRLGATLDGRWRLLQGPGGVLQAQTLPDGTPQAVPGAPPAAQP